MGGGNWERTQIELQTEWVGGKSLCIETVVGGFLKLINFIIYIYNSFNKCFIII